MARRLLRLLSVLVIACFFSRTAAADSPEPSPSADLVIVTSRWSYAHDFDSSWPTRVYVAVEIRNGSAQYVSNIAVRFIVRSYSGAELDRSTSAPLKTSLAPGESTFFHDYIVDTEVYVPYSVDFVAFGDVSSQAQYPYLPDPQPLYFQSHVDGGTVTYYGEIVNTTNQTWKASCDSCDAAELIGVYYENGQMADWTSSGLPVGHLLPGGKIAFKFSFDRVPGASFKMFSRVEPLPAGSYATSWSIENLQWALGIGTYGRQEVAVSARVRNMSSVSVEPNVTFVGRDAAGKWIGWSVVPSYYTNDIAPGGYQDISDAIDSSDMHVGELAEIRSVEALVGSFVTSDQPPPTSTPTRTVTRTPTITLTPSRTATPTLTRTPTPSATPRPVQVIVDIPAEAASVGSQVVVSGWAIDPASSSGTGVDGVDVYIDSGSNPWGAHIGVASYGLPRQDIATLWGQRFLNSGYTITWQLGGTPPGTYSIYVHAHSVLSGWHYTERSIVVPLPTPTATGTAAAASTQTPTATATQTESSTGTPTKTQTPSKTGTATRTSTRTRTPTKTATGTKTGTATKTLTATRTGTSTKTPTATETATVTSTPSAYVYFPLVLKVATWWTTER